MSVILTLTSAAIIAGVSMATATSMAVISQVKDGTFEATEGIDTMFVDGEILLKTLQSYDCHIETISENEFLVKTTCGVIRYARENAGQAFKMYLNEIEDVDGLLQNLKSFEMDYGRNVQDYTYHHIKDNLSEGMQIVDEAVLDDNSLLLTIQV